MGIDWFLFHRGCGLQLYLNPRRTKRESHFSDIECSWSAIQYAMRMSRPAVIRLC
jgi:hypothetical protein